MLSQVELTIALVDFFKSCNSRNLSQGMGSCEKRRAGGGGL